MPPSLKERVRAAAAENKRSMNAEIVATLEEKYPEPQYELEELVEELALLNFTITRLTDTTPDEERALKSRIVDIVKRISDHTTMGGLREKLIAHTTED